MVDYSHVEAIYDFCKAHKYKVTKLNTIERKNGKGPFHHVELELIIPIKKPVPAPKKKDLELEPAVDGAELVAEVEDKAELKEELEKEEVISDEI